MVGDIKTNAVLFRKGLIHTLSAWILLPFRIGDIETHAVLFRKGLIHTRAIRLDTASV